jgi:NDP-sugar pyrophosphorylase family protein
VHAILLVGGKGTRMLPHTRHRPKALLKFGDYPLLEIILRRLRACGFQRVTLCISHLGEMIQAEFGDGARLGLAVDYCVDDRPLGTAAPLRQVTDWTTPALVMNGDLLTALDFTALYQAHVRSECALTVAYQCRWVNSGVGLLRLNGSRVTGLQEKPRFEWNVNSGIYVADPSVRGRIPGDDPVDMPELIGLLIDEDAPVHAYRFTESWHDIGTPARHEEAQRAFLADPQLYLSPAGAGAAAGRP